MWRTAHRLSILIYVDADRATAQTNEERTPAVRELELRNPDGTVAGQLARFRSRRDVLVKPGPTDEVMHVLRGGAVVNGHDPVVQGDWLLLRAGCTYELRIAAEGMRALIVPDASRVRTHV